MLHELASLIQGDTQMLCSVYAHHSRIDTTYCLCAMSLKLYCIFWSRVLIMYTSDTSLLMQIVTHSSDLRGAGTDATVSVELNGELGSTPRCNLVASDSATDSFARGQTDSFTLQLPELGMLQSITIGSSFV